MSHMILIFITRLTGLLHTERFLWMKLSLSFNGKVIW